MTAEQAMHIATVLSAIVGSLLTVWIALRRYRHEAAVARAMAETRAEEAKREQGQLEMRLRQEQMASEMAQTEMENEFRIEMREDIARVRLEARDLAAQLRLSEDENRKLRQRVFELEMEIARLRATLSNSGISGAHGPTISTGGTSATMPVTIATTVTSGEPTPTT